MRRGEVQKVGGRCGEICGSTECVSQWRRLFRQVLWPIIGRGGLALVLGASAPTSRRIFPSSSKRKVYSNNFVSTLTTTRLTIL